MSNEKDIAEVMASLGDEEMARVEKLMRKLADNKHGRRKRKPKKRFDSEKPLDNDESEAKVTQSGRRKRPRIGGREEEEPIKAGAGRRGQDPTPQRGKRKRNASREPIDTSGTPRENEFLKMKHRGKRIAESSKADTAIQKKLSSRDGAEIELTERGDVVELIEAQCKGCKYWFDVLPHLLFNDPDMGIVFECNDCTTGRK